MEAQGTAESLQQAAEGYEQAGLSGHQEAFIRLGYLYEARKLLQATTGVGYEPTIEERRFIDALAAHYIEKGGSFDAVTGVSFTFGNGDDPFGFGIEEFSPSPSSEDAAPPSDTSLPASFAAIQDDAVLSLKERFFRMGQFYETLSQSDEGFVQRRLRFAYASRLYDQAALWHRYPASYTALGHMYYFGKGVDISDQICQESAALQARQYYEEGAQRGDPEAQFMMGFLLEQEHNEGADTQAQVWYQQAAASGYEPACFRLGVRSEQGQEDMGTVEKRKSAYAQAKGYYEQAQSSRTIIPHPLVLQVMNIPPDLNSKIARVQQLQEEAETLAIPAYALTEYGFCTHLQKSLPAGVLPYWIHWSLMSYAHTHSLAYNADPQATENRVQQIASLFSGAGSYAIPDLNLQEQKMLNAQSEKSPGAFHAQAQRMRQMQLRQRLGGEDPKWRDKVQEDSAITHADDWMTAITPLIQAVYDAPQAFDGKPFLATVSGRLIQAAQNARQTHLMTNIPEGRLLPPNLLGQLGTSLQMIQKEATEIFAILKPWQRTLAEQICFYQSLQLVKNHTGQPVSDSFLATLALARDLMKEAHTQDSPDSIIKHFQSAQALQAYAAEKTISVYEAKAGLDARAKERIPLLSPRIHDFSSIGYHILVALVSKASTGAIASDKSHHYREQLMVSLAQDNLDQNWFRTTGSCGLKPETLSGLADPVSASLTKLYEQAVQFLEQKAIMDDPSQPHLDVRAITDQDPAIGLYGSFVKEAFQDLQNKAAALYQSGIFRDSGDSEQKIYESVLNECIQDICKKMKMLSGVDIRYIDNIIGTLEGSDRGITQKVDRKQNLLFMLCKSADWDQGTEEERLLAYHAIINGTKGRCPDGQASFFQQWGLDYILNHLRETNAEVLSDEAISISISLLLQDYKRVFIENHMSPFLVGARIHLGAYEDRTAMHTLLTQMLRIPLSLTGSFSKVLYPGFAVRHLENSQTAIQIQEVLKRFLTGGKIIYKDMRTLNASGTLDYQDRDENDNPEIYQKEIAFEGLTLKVLARELRDSLVDLKREDVSTPTERGLLPPPRLNFIITEAGVENFMQHDPTMASFYTAFHQSGYTQGNIFFNAKAAFEKGYQLRYVLTDAALLRILQVGGYALVPEGFYQNIPQDWRF